MDLKNENKNRQKDLENDSSDSEMSEEELDLTKRQQDINNMEQIDPSKYYEENQKKQNQQQQQQQQQVDNEDEKMVDDEYDMVNVDFNFYDPSERQFHSIKILVNGFLDGLSYNSSDLADIIVKQVQVGTMIGIDDQEEDANAQQNILGFTTTLQLNEHKNQKVFQEIGQFVAEKSKKHYAKHDQLMSILDNQNVNIGLLVNERILNCSPFIVPTLHTQFQEDLKWLVTEEPEEGKKFQFDYLLVLSKVYKPLKESKQQQQKNQKKKPNGLQEYVYQKFEDYKFLEKSEHHFMFEAENTKSGGGVTNHNQDIKDQICYRTVYLLKWSDYVNTVPLLNQELIPIHQQQMSQQSSNF